MYSPMKSVSLSGTIKTEAPYQLTMKNLYDNKPVTASLTMDPSRPTVDFNMNFDKGKRL